MQDAVDWVREAIAAHLHADASLTLAEAQGRDEAEARRIATRARALLGTGEARERLEEAVSTRSIDDASHGALLDHVADVAEREVIARRATPFSLASNERVVVEDRERTLLELASDARDPAPPRARTALSALLDRQDHDRAARLEVAHETSERRERIRARGPAMPDDAPADLVKQCAAFLEATDDAAAELVLRALHAAGAPSLVTRVAVLAPVALNAIVPSRGRARRLGTLLDAVDLGPELRDRIDLGVTGTFSLAPTLVQRGARATVLASELDVGVISERALLSSLVTALTRVLFSRSLPIEHAHAPRGSAAAAMGALFGSFFADSSLVARHVDAPAAACAHIALSTSLAMVLEARWACVPSLAHASGERSDDRARELAARALVLDPSLVTPELARSSWLSPVAAETRVRSLLAALAWAPPLRERYDEDFLRNPRIADFLRGTAARGGMVSAEGISEELGATAAHAIAHVVELAERAGG